MQYYTPPRPDKIRALESASGWSWVDHRIKWLWDDMAREELLLYFFLASVSNKDGCSWWSSRQITKILKIGPATLIRARGSLEERELIATQKEELSNRTVYQILPIPMIIDERTQIPKKKSLRKGGSKGAENKLAEAVRPGAADPGAITDQQHKLGLKYLEEIQRKLQQS